MLKKLLYIGLGISIIALKKSADYLIAKRDEINEQVLSSTEAEEQQAAVAVADDIDESEKAPITTIDDLTRINGIGPTYARRLKEAGIITFGLLAEQTPDSLTEITSARGKSADPDSWIAQAKELA